MTDGPTTPASSSLVTRVKNILMTPRAEWPRIDVEPATVASIFTSYVLILAAIGPICRLIGQQAFGISFFGVTYTPPIGYSIAYAVLGYILSIVGTYVIALIIDALAPSFGGTKDPVKAVKVAAYSFTASWVAGIFYIVPQLGILAILGLYSLYLLFLGLPVLMKVPQDKAIGYTVVVVIAAIVVWIVIGIIVAALVTSFFPLSSMVGAGSLKI
jgi:hypothetical protein